MNIEQYRQRLLEKERELVERLGREVSTARDAHEDQSSAGDLAHADELKDEYFALAETDSVILAQVRAALKGSRMGRSASASSTASRSRRSVLTQCHGRRTA
jgi:hypothetical protein